ncbi:MAG: SDR family oxidoreductase [Streptococcaceae bacterium]|jgi:NAD(P)-dependent dehydrogenase (short-subunit alcohol dehydrogenase family)|nr:SDR family oxidoreductase [Streptococcaceae bacterium]
MYQKFDGKNVVVTGGSRGIGLAIAHQFAKRGARVVITATTASTLETTLILFQHEKLQAVKGLVLDLSAPLAIDSFWDKVQELFNGESVDILVNNAGISDETPLAEIESEQIQQVFQVNLIAPILLSKAFAAQFVSKPTSFGSIINISSIASRFDDPNHLIYGVSKAGINKLTQNLAKQLGKQGIRVNAILPGSIDTDMTREKYSHPEIYQALVNRLPLSKRGTGADIAHLAVFLASREADYITGQLIAVDGGWLLQ